MQTSVQPLTANRHANRDTMAKDVCRFFGWHVACRYWMSACLVLSLACLAAACGNSQSRAPAPAEAESNSALFTAVAEQAGLAAFRHVHGGFGEFWMPEIMGSGGGFIDFDGDGWEDILLVGGGSLPGQPAQAVPALALFRNSGDGTFSDVTHETGLSDARAYGVGIAAADYDNDGDTDILLTTLLENMLFRNDGGIFQEVGGEAGIADVALWSTSAMFLDADRDGNLDLYVANYLRWTPETDIVCMDVELRDYCNPRDYAGVIDAFYRNNGDGTFSNRTAAAGFLNSIRPEESKGLGVGELDYDKDGWPDIYVANDGERNFLFRNNRDGTFSEVAVRSGVALDKNGTPRAGMGVDSGVIDSTGEVAIFVGNFSDEMVSVWRHDGDGFFTDWSASSRIGFLTLPTLTFGLVLFDVDLDTDLDVLLANGHVLKHVWRRQFGITFEQQPQLFLNRGDGKFDALSPPTGPLAELMVARGLAAGDFDRDGDLDILVTENAGPVRLWRNELPARPFLRVRLEGTESNRDALGAHIRATVGGLVMERRIRTGSSYLSQSEMTATFGTGNAPNVTSLEVSWPSGQVERFEQIVPSQEVLLVEGTGKLVPMLARDR